MRARANGRVCVVQNLGATPLMTVVGRGYLDIAKQLLAAGADVHAVMKVFSEFFKSLPAVVRDAP